MPGTQVNITLLTNRIRALLVLLRAVEVSVTTKASSVDLAAVNSRLTTQVLNRALVLDIRAVESAAQAGLCDLSTTISSLLLSSLVNIDADLGVAVMNRTRDLRHVMSELVQGKEGALWDRHMIYDKLVLV